MRLKELAVKDLFCYHDVRVEFPPDRPIALFFAENGSGKTSLRHIIEVLLTADVQDLDGTAIRLERLRRTGADKGGVQGIIARPGKEDLTIKRTVTGKGISTRVNGHENPSDISDHLGGALKPDLLYRALANVTGFFRLKPAEQKALLLSLIPQDIPAKLVEGLPLGDRPAPKTLDDLDLAYKDAFERRKMKKRDLDGVAVPPNEVLNRFPVDMKDIDDRLAALEAEKDALLKDSGELISQARLYAQQIEELQGRVSEADFEMAGFANHDTLVADADRLDSVYTEVSGRADEWTKGNNEVVELSRRLQGLAGAHLKLSDVNGRCVVGGDVTCPMTGGDKERALKVLQDRIDQANTDIAAIKARIGTPPDVHGARKALQDARQAVKDRAEWQRKKDEALEGIAVIEAKRGLLADPGAAEQKLATLRERIDKGKQTRQKALGLNRERDEAQAAKAAREALAPEVEALERLVSAFGPKGIRERLLLDRVADLVQSINAILGAFGLRLEFSDDPFETRINGMPAALMAESEQFRAGVAFQVALASATGVRFVVVDGADVLDGANRKALWATLLHATQKGMVDQAIVMATYVTPEPPAKAPAGFAVYHIARTPEGSTVHPLTA